MLRNYKDKTLDKKEAHIKKRWHPIKFRDNIEIKSLKDIFHYLFNKTEATLYLDGKLHCLRGKGRSYYDAYMLCMYYLPNLSLKEMYRELQELIDLNTKYINKKNEGLWYHEPGYIDDHPHFFGCPDIGRLRCDGRIRFHKKIGYKTKYYVKERVG